VFEDLGVTHVCLVDRRPGDGVAPLLISGVGEDGAAALSLHGPPQVVVDPSEGRGCREALLPTDMDFPLTELWRVRRPGPRLEVYALE
jgi:hypothetical protein